MKQRGRRSGPKLLSSNVRLIKSHRKPLFPLTAAKVGLQAIEP